MSAFRDYWANREPRRSRHAEHQVHPLLVADLLLQAWDEGRPVALDWQGQDVTGLVWDQSAERYGHVEPIADDEDTEPTTATRDDRRWLGSEWFAPGPRSLAGQAVHSIEIYSVYCLLRE